VYVKQQQQEVQHGDDLLLLAAHALRDLYQLTEAATTDQDVASDVASDASDAKLHAYLLRVETAALLEFGMACSPCNYHFKILVMEVSLCCVAYI
jgi:N-acetyltransferase B complex (NatB) non catalytic subunit